MAKFIYISAQILLRGFIKSLHEEIEAKLFSKIKQVLRPNPCLIQIENDFGCSFQENDCDVKIANDDTRRCLFSETESQWNIFLQIAKSMAGKSTIVSEQTTEESAINTEEIDADELDEYQPAVEDGQSTENENDHDLNNKVQQNCMETSKYGDITVGTTEVDEDGQTEEFMYEEEPEQHQELPIPLPNPVVMSSPDISLLDLIDKVKMETDILSCQMPDVPRVSIEPFLNKAAAEIAMISEPPPVLPPPVVQAEKPATTTKVVSNPIYSVADACNTNRSIMTLSQIQKIANRLSLKEDKSYRNKITAYEEAKKTAETIQVGTAAVTTSKPYQLTSFSIPTERRELNIDTNPVIMERKQRMKLLRKTMGSVERLAQAAEALITERNSNVEHLSTLLKLARPNREHPSKRIKLTNEETSTTDLKQNEPKVESEGPPRSIYNPAGINPFHRNAIIPQVPNYGDGIRTQHYVGNSKVNKRGVLWGDKPINSIQQNNKIKKLQSSSISYSSQRSSILNDPIHNISRSTIQLPQNGSLKYPLQIPAIVAREQNAMSRHFTRRNSSYSLSKNHTSPLFSPIPSMGARCSPTCSLPSTQEIMTTLPLSSPKSDVPPTAVQQPVAASVEPENVENVELAAKMEPESEPEKPKRSFFMLSHKTHVEEKVKSSDQITAQQSVDALRSSSGTPFYILNRSNNSEYHNRAILSRKFTNYVRDPTIDKQMSEVSTDSVTGEDPMDCYADQLELKIKASIPNLQSYRIDHPPDMSNIAARTMDNEMRLRGTGNWTSFGRGLQASFENSGNVQNTTPNKVESFVEPPKEERARFNEFRGTYQPVNRQSYSVDPSVLMQQKDDSSSKHREDRREDKTKKKEKSTDKEKEKEIDRLINATRKTFTL